MISFTVPGQPQGKGRHRTVMRGKIPHNYTPEATVNYENYIKFLYQKTGGKIHDKPLRLSVRAYFLAPLSWSNKKRLAALGGEIKPTVKPDADNILKVVCDALNKIAFLDDKQIVAVSCYKMYDVAPRLEIEIKEVLQ